MVQDGIPFIQDLRNVNGLIIEFLFHISNSYEDNLCLLLRTLTKAKHSYKATNYIL